MSDVTFRKPLLAAALMLGASLGLSAGAAQAGTISFDGLTGGMSEYTEDDFILSPVKFNNGLCASDPCTGESGQAELPSMVHKDGLAFDLLSFWFVPIGNGTGEDNYVSVTGFTGNAVDGYAEKSGASLEFRLDDLLSSFAPEASVAYAAGGSDPGSPAAKAACMNTKICKNFGYTVSILGGLFDDVTKVTWQSFGTAAANIDEIGYDIEVAPVPVPAAGLMLAGGLGLIGAAKRRRKARA